MKKIIASSLISAAVMFLLPYAAVTLVRGDAGMLACIVMFFIIDPAYSVMLGAYAGRCIRRLWILPVISAAFYLICALLIFDPHERLFFLYAGIYLLLGLIAMFISAAIKHKK